MTGYSVTGVTDLIHPYEKSLPHYVRIGYLFATGERFPFAVDTVLAGLSELDTSVLVVDDILDDSLTRAGRPALHRSAGVKSAIVESMLQLARAVDSMRDTATALGTPAATQARIYLLLNKFVTEMYTAQKLDLEARHTAEFEPSMLLRYHDIVYGITASHVRLGLECGQLLAGLDPEPGLSRAADAIGVVRQVRDDFDDYFDEHHEPFGDFTGALNRLPELLFKRDGGDRQQVLSLLDQGRTRQARRQVLTPSVRHGVYEYCMSIRSAVDDADAALFLQPLETDIEIILSRQD
jgi:geranylgeranyl pyrophosphate synthase